MNAAPKKYLPGVNDAVARVKEMNRAQLLAHIQRLFGLPSTMCSHCSTDDAIRQEAVDQTFRDFEV